jgi:hypothetical protein
MKSEYSKYGMQTLAVVAYLTIVGPPAASAQTLQITAPSAGAVVNPGQIVSVALAVSGVTLTHAFVLSETPIADGQDLTAPPYQFSLQVPANINLRSYRLVAAGVDASGNSYSSSPVTIDVERTDNPTSIAANPTPLYKMIGDTSYVRVTATYADGAVLDATESSLVSYASGDPAVATVDNVGRVSAVGAGSTNITITYGTLSVTVPVTVPPQLAVRCGQSSVFASQTAQFYADFAMLPDPNASGPPNSDVSWTLTPALGTIDANGLYTAPASVSSWQGVTVTATSAADPTKSASAQIWILPPVTLALSPPSATLLAGQHLELSANRNNDGGAWVSWSLSPADAGSFWDSQNSSAFPYSIPLGEYTAPSPIVSPQTVTVTSSRRNYNRDILMNARAHAWGFYFDAPVVSSQIKEHVRQFRSRPGNPPAAAQADVVAHRMGGMVARSLVGLHEYAGTESFSQGSIHKLITIGTPHYGTPLAADLLGSPCLWAVLANAGNAAIQQALIGCPSCYGGTPVNGAVGDLVGAGDGLNVNYSAAISKIENISTVVPTATIATAASDFNRSSLDNSLGVAHALRLKCGSDPLALRLTSTGSQAEFGYHPNDAIVPVSSQLRMSTSGSGYLHSCVHSNGTTQLGFNPPFQLNPDPNDVCGVQSLLKTLLNWPRNDTNVFKAIP